jgi:hypothetical protein
LGKSEYSIAGKVLLAPVEKIASSDYCPKASVVAALDERFMSLSCYISLVQGARPSRFNIHWWLRMHCFEQVSPQVFSKLVLNLNCFIEVFHPPFLFCNAPTAGVQGY